MKKSKKIIASLITIIVLASIVGVIFYTSSYADGEKMYLAAAVLNPKTGTGYAVKDPTHARIWNFLEYPDQNATLTQNDIRPNYYCLKAGVGFTSEIDQDTLITTTPIEYSVKYDMKTQKDDMLSKNDATINSIVNGTIENNVSKYSALLALLDLLYYPTTSNTDSDEDAKAFLESAGIFTEEYLDSNLLKNEDIRAVQQAAIWYFTNYGEKVGSAENFYDNTGDSEIATWLYYSTNGKDYNALYSTSANRSARAIQAQTLYNYLVETAKDNASQYDNGGNNSEPVKVTQTPNYEANGNNYILGPIKIETDTITNPTISLQVKNGQNNISYTLLDESKKTVSNNNINEVIGKNFYISIPKSDVTNVTVNINYTYTEKKLTLWTNAGGTTQPILVPETTNKQGTTTINFEIEKTQVTVNKKWEDNNNQDGVRTTYGVTLTGKVGNKTVYTDTQTLNKETTYTWNNLDKYSAGQEIVYTVDETKVPTDYEKQVTGNAETGFTITNTHEPEEISVKVNKVWDDNNNQDGKRTEYEVTLTGKVGSETVYTNTQKLSADKLEYTWNNLAKYKNGQEIVYTVDETKVPADYTKEVTGSATEGFKITNKYTPEKTSVKVTKVWDDNNNQDGKRAEYEVTITGKAGSDTVYTDKQTLNSDKLEYTWNNLAKYKNGQEIVYTVDETKIPTGYEKEVTGSATEGFKITNKYTPEKTSVKVTKVWDDNNDQDKIRGEYSVTITGKVGNEEVYTDTQTLGADKLEYTWNNLDKYKNGQEIVYTVDETKIPDGYEKEVAGNAGEGFKITNKHESNKTFDLSLRKYITQVTTNEVTTNLEDSGDLTRTPNIDTSNLVAGSTAGAGQTTATYKHRKDPVEVKNGSEVIYNITVYNEGETLGRATEIIDQLPTGVEFVEVVSGGYTANYDKASNKLTLTKTGTNNLAANTNGNLSSETIQIKVKVTANAGSTNKVLTNIAWISKEVKVDANGTETEVTNQKGIDRDSEPETITTKTADELVTEDTGYTGNDSNSEKDLSSKDSYFEGQQDDDDFEKIIIKATTSVSVTKVWNDNNDQDGIRPDSVSVSLLANNVVKETVPLSEGNAWSHTFTNLPVEDEDGTPITYTVKENDVPTGYEANVTKDTTETTSISGTQNTAQSIYRVTNTYESVRTFDLSLRKYITQVTTDGITTNLEADTNLTRTPNIDTSNLVAGSTAGADQTTAIYKHKKDPVEVKTGSEVIYNITVYNEGEKQGRATEIVDQLPAGLEFMEVVSGDYSANYDKDSNKLTLTKTGTNNLAVNADGNLSSETIQIKAKVTATVGSTDKVLTNIAWISKEVKVDENGTETEVTNEKGIDRDSEPGTITTKTQDELVTSDTGYIGNNSNSSKDLSSKDSYFEGQQDDDDFEKVILKKAEGTYEIQLLKVDSENVNKTLSGAEFKITLPDGSTKNVTTDGQGKITISGINITNEGIDTITIEETKAPTDYEKMIESFTLQVTKKIQNGNYIVTEANLANSQNGVTVVLNGNTINVMVLNEEIQKPVDFKLIKRIVSVNDENVPERIEKIDVSNLNLLDSDGNLLSDGTEKYTTAQYSLNKEPVLVKKGDIVTYTFRVYNEGLVNGYVQEITEDIPEGLEFLWSNKQGTDLENDETLTDAEKEAIKFNQDNLWVISKQDENDKVIEIKTDYLSQENGTVEDGTNSNLIEAFGENNGTKTAQDLHYKEVSVKLKVIAENITGTVIRNESAITDDLDEEGNEVEDRDSKPEEWPGKDDHDNYQDDEDYDNIKLQSFDLALRKYIAAVSHDTTIEDSEYLRNEDGSYTRAPKVDTSKLNAEDENGNIITTATYNHTKELVLIQPNDVIVYHLRVYNEGEIDGYAAEIKDHLPPYLEFVDGEFNEQYGWKVSDDGRTVTTNYLESEDKIIKAATTNEDGTIVLSYQEVPIMCKVIDTAPTSQNITNIADITKYLDDERKDVTDRDSQEDNVQLPKDEDLPNYKEDENGSYVPGQQDDDDFEKVIIKKFDLSLRKWVTEAIVIENGVETVTATGHDPYDDPEQIVKVELHRKKINQVEVKFRYSIRVTNEGEIAGYAKEVTDYIPEGLKFVEEDNQNWIDEGNNVISTTQLADTLLQPGEYKDIEVILTWVNNENNMGVMTNTAEISEDYNEYGVPDIDSTPDNQKEGEDDIDDAPVMLSVSTGQMRIYFTLGFIILITLAGGVVLIKKHVLGEN